MSKPTLKELSDDLTLLTDRVTVHDYKNGEIRDAVLKRLTDLEKKQKPEVSITHCCVEFARHVTLGSLVFRPPTWTTRASYVKIKWCPFCGEKIKHE